jgi:8-oxo-dGTP diphosphatase
MAHGPQVGVGVIVIKDDKVLMAKRKNAHGDGSWSFIGGHLEFNETPEECARREIEEESGIRVKNIQHAYFTNDIFPTEQKHYVTLFLVAEHDRGEPEIREPDRNEAWEWFSWNELPQPLFIPIQNLLKTGFNPFHKNGPTEYKTPTIKTYNLYPAEFNQKFDDHFTNLVQKEAEEFIPLLPGKRLLDLGSGPGNHALFFHNQNLDVHCIDLSEEMVKLCKEKGLNAEVMDIENLTFAPESFDGIWAYASLLHIPKERIPALVPRLADILKPGGMLALALKKGEGQGFETHASYPGTQRWFSYFSDREVRELFDSHFEVVGSGETKAKNKYTFMKHFLRKRDSV